MQTKLITIDFWNTLVDSSNGIKRNGYRQKVLVEEMRETGADITHEIWEKATKASWEHFNSIWINEQRTPTPDETVKFYWKFLELPVNSRALEICKEAFAMAILKYPPKLVDNAKEALDKLRENYTLAIVSDTGFSPGKVLKELLERLGVLNYFSAFSFSDETGVSKPHPKAFQTILDELDFHPKEAIHIGDLERTDIVGAKGVNMGAIRFMGDPTGVLNKKNPQSTIADAEVFSWAEAVEKILNFK